MRNKPRIRFKGFTEDWEQRKLDDVFEIVDGDRGKNYPGTGDFLSNGDVLFLDTGNVRKDGFNFDNRRYIDFNRDKLLRNGRLILGDYVLTSRGTLGNLAYYSQSVYDRYPQVRINSAMLILRVMNTIKVNNLYLYITLRSNVINEFMKHNFVGSAQPHITKKEFSSVLLPIPRQLEEQKMIGDFFDRFEKTITLHQRKLEKLKLAKKALLQKLFPKNGSQFPEIRFKGFTDAWEQRKFSDIFAEIKSGLSRMLSNDDIGLPVVRANNINDGQLNLVDDIKYWYKNDPQGANTNNYLIEQGDILINFINSEAKMGTAAYVTRRQERDTIYTTNILRCKVNDEYNPYFIYSLTFLNSYKNYIASITKPAVNQASFTTVDFKKYSIKIPTVKEQNQIADLIETFNKLITLHQRKLDKLQDMKKGLLQKMFV